MAKVSSLFNFRGTFGDVTFVQSKRYGNHVRARRGTKSPAHVNDSLVASTRALKVCNVYAKAVKDGVDPYRVVKDGTFWSRLVQFFRKASVENSTIDLFKLKNFAVSRNQLRQVLNRFELHVEQNEALHASIRYSDPHFHCATGATHYKLSIIAIFFREDFSLIGSNHCTVSGEITLNNEAKKYSDRFEIPAGAGITLVAVSCSAMQGSSVSLGAAGFALEVVDVVKCGR